MAQTLPPQQIPPGMGKTEEWKAQLKAPTKDTRIKTEVRQFACHPIACRVEGTGRCL